MSIHVDTQRKKEASKESEGGEKRAMGKEGEKKRWRKRRKTRKNDSEVL